MTQKDVCYSKFQIIKLYIQCFYIICLQKPLGLNIFKCDLHAKNFFLSVTHMFK